MIDPRAIVDSQARLDSDVTVGPFAVIGPGVEIGAGSTVGAHAVVQGPTRIGRDTRIFPYASIGLEPQDKKYAGEDTSLVIGDHNTIREFCTINRGTRQDRGETRLGDDNWIMAYVHVAHDCVIGSHTILANNTTLGGHVEIGDWAILGGFSKIHQYCRLGAHCFTEMDAGIKKDVPPYVMAGGMPARPRGINVEGLRRRNFAAKTIRAIQQAYRILYRSGLLLSEAVIQIRNQVGDCPELALLINFLGESKRSIIR